MYAWVPPYMRVLYQARTLVWSLLSLSLSMCVCITCNTTCSGELWSSITASSNSSYDGGGSGGASSSVWMCANKEDGDFIYSCVFKNHFFGAMLALANVPSITLSMPTSRTSLKGKRPRCEVKAVIVRFKSRSFYGCTLAFIVICRYTHAYMYIFIAPPFRCTCPPTFRIHAWLRRWSNLLHCNSVQLDHRAHVDCIKRLPELPFRVLNRCKRVRGVNGSRSESGNEYMRLPEAQTKALALFHTSSLDEMLGADDSADIPEAPDEEIIKRRAAAHRKNQRRRTENGFEG